MQTTFQSLLLVPGIWTLSLAAVASLCSLAGTVWLARYRFRLNFYKAETERQLMLREQARLDLVTQRDQARLDRALEVQLDTIAHALKRLEIKPEILFAFPSLAEAGREALEEGKRQAA